MCIFSHSNATLFLHQLLDRSQQRLELVLIPESQFVRRYKLTHLLVLGIKPQTDYKRSHLLHILLVLWIKPQTATDHICCTISNLTNSQLPASPVRQSRDFEERTRIRTRRGASGSYLLKNDFQLRKIIGPSTKALWPQLGNVWMIEALSVKVVASEQSEWWLSVHDILHFLPHNDPTQVRFWSKSFCSTRS